MLPGVAASTGSACHAGSVTISPVLAGHGGCRTERGWGRYGSAWGGLTTLEELEEVLGMLKASV